MGNETCDRIKGLRSKLGLNQEQFAQKVGVTQPTVSGWEASEESIPSSESFMRMGNLAGFPDAFFFWGQGGLDAQAMLSYAEQLLKERGLPPQEGEIIRISSIRKTAEGTENLDRLVPFPGVANPGSTICLIVDDSAASPGVRSGDAIVLDTSHSDAGDLLPFWDKIVAVDAAPEAGSKYPLGHIHYHPGGGSSQPWRGWAGRVLMGRLRFKQFRHPNMPRSEQLPLVGATWVATLGPFGDCETEWQSGDKELHLGEWSDRESWSRQCRLQQRFYRIEDREALAAATDALGAEEREQARSKIRLEPAYHILGRVIWFGPESRLVEAK